MPKKLSLLLAAAAVLAFAVPAFANAATGLTEGATLVSTGTIITGTNVGASVVTSTKTGNITCASGAVMAEGKLTVNTLNEVVAEKGGNTTYTASCTNSTGGAATVKNIQINKLETTGGGKGTLSVFFEIELSPKGTVCKYTGTNDVFTYNPTETAEGANLVDITKQPLSVIPAACGTTSELDGAFKLATAGTMVSVHLM